MAVKKPNFALDLTSEGVNLWQRGRFNDWLGLGFVPNAADNFTQAIETLRMNAAQQGQVSAEIRVAKAEVYFTKIPSDTAPDKPTDEAILKLIAERIPFRDKAARMIVDTSRRGAGDLAVAVVPASVLQRASEFALSHGFEPSYFTTLYNPMMFPAEPRFRLVEPGRPLLPPKPAPKPRRTLTIAAVTALAVFGLAVAGAMLFPPLQSASVGADAETVSSTAHLVPASIVLPDLKLPVPDTIATGAAVPTPDFAADVAAPQFKLDTPTRIAVAPDTVTPEIVGFHPQPRRAPDKVSVRKGIAVGSEFEPTGLAKQTKRLLNNSVISIEEPATGETGRKTIRILPSDLGKGSLIRRFDPESFVRVAQAQSANDAVSGLPDVDNELLRVNEDGVPLFKGAPDTVPPPRPATTPMGTDDDLEAFSDSIERVLDGPDAGVDLSGIRIQTPTLGTLRPRPNPFVTQTQSPEAQPAAAYPVNTATAATLRPRSRPASLIRKIQQLEINAAAELAAKEAIRESMPTENALFVSLIPKPRPNRIKPSVVRTVPGLTTANTGSNAVVRTAPASGGKSTGTMAKSKTPESVAALATESARISKHSLSLIGIFGSSSSRRALLRLPTGRYIKVKQGDDVRGWNVSAIGEDSVRIKKGSRNEVLRMPE